MNTRNTIQIRRPLGVVIRHHLTCLRHCAEQRRQFHYRRLRELEQKLPDGCRLDLSGADPCTANLLRAYRDYRDGGVLTEIALVLHLNGLDMHAEPAQPGKLYQQLAEEVTIALHHEQVELLS